MGPSWTPVAAADEIPDGGSKLVTRGRDRIALFRQGDQVYAVDDRCPHEGFPLIQGSLCGNTLTCCFHNFKFDVRDGSCLVGDEAVRAWPARIVDGTVELDVTPPDPSASTARRWASLRGAMTERKLGQVARDVVRLLDAGVDPVAIARFAAAWDAEYAEYGTTHALPVAADLLRWLPRYPGLEAARPLVQVLEIASEPSVRRAPRPVADPADPGDPETFAERLHQRIEVEDLDGAEAMFRGALAAGFGRDRVEPALLRLCADHFLDYGHALIYTVKAFDLVDVAGWDAALEILPALVAMIGFGTREDTLPAWSGWRHRTEALGELGALAVGTGDLADPDALIATVLDGRGAEAEGAVVAALRSGVAVDAVARALCVAAALRVLRFDPAIDADLSCQDDWLSASHVQTFANAVRVATGRWPGAGAVRLLLQGVRMISMTRPLDGPVDAWRDDPLFVEAAAALRADPEGLRARWMDRAIGDGAVRGIVVAHGIKQLVAGFDDAAATGRPEPVLAAIRFAAAPKRERRMARLVGEAIRLVAEGRTPRRIVP